MKLAVNAIPLLGPMTGVGKYTYEISRRLNGINTSFYYGFYSKKLITKKIEINKISFLKRAVKKLLSKAPKLYDKKFDVYFEPNFVINENIKAKKRIATIHDFSFMIKEWHPKERVEFFEKNFWKNIKLADEIIVVSEFVKHETLKYLDFKEENIHVIYNGVDHDVFKKYPEHNLIKIKEKFNLPDDFILFVGSIEPRKNLLNLLEAYDMLSSSTKNDFPLILAGFSGWNNNEIMDLIDKNSKFIRYLGYIETDELAKLYNLASIFVYPSLYEGFGLPPLEAMACGTPVLVSNRASMPEVCQNYASYCNPQQPDDIKYQLENLINDSQLRNKLSSEGIEYTKNFDWDKSASKHLQLFKETVC